MLAHVANLDLRRCRTIAYSRSSTPWYNASRWSSRGSFRAAEHPISRRDIDPDALKVLYRLRQFNTSPTSSAAASAICCSAAGQRISTSARRPIPYQIKKLFRNCWIIGRRFRLAHVKFGTKVIEVATFRRQVAGRRRDRPGTACQLPREPSDHACGRRSRCITPPRQHVRHAGRGRVPPRLHHQRAVLRHRDILA